MNYSNNKIKVTCGPMKSGKSKELFNDIDRLKHQNIPYLIFKPHWDTRTVDSVVTRYLPQTLTAVTVESSAAIIETLHKQNISAPFCVLIDEAQFFDKDIVDVVKRLSQKGFSVFLYGLDTDAKWNTFGSIGDLLAMANIVVKITATCDSCRQSASKTTLAKHTEGFEENNVIIDDGKTENPFKVVCDECFFQSYVDDSNWKCFQTRD